MDAKNVRGPWQRWQRVDYGHSGSLDYRIIFVDEEGRERSLWNDIPLYAENGFMNFVCKTPQGTSTDLCVAIEEDVPSFMIDPEGPSLNYSTCPSAFNVGILPQTWADPKKHLEEFDYLEQSGQPLNVVDIGKRKCQIGDVFLVKPLSAFLVLKGSNMFWNIITIDSQDPRSSKIHSILDVEKDFPDTYEEIIQFFKSIYSSGEAHADACDTEPEASRQEDDCRFAEKFLVECDQVKELVDENHQSWKIIAESHREWLNCSKELFNYGRMVWENYTIYNSQAYLTPKSNKSTLSFRSYESAWQSTSETGQSFSSNENSLPPMEGIRRRERRKSSFTSFDFAHITPKVQPSEEPEIIEFPEQDERREKYSASNTCCFM